MSHHWKVAAELRQQGHRLTPQRLTLLEAIQEAPGHFTADELFDQVQRSMPYLNPSTVYRTLQWLEETGLVVRVDLGDGVSRYAYAPEHHHHHLFCDACGRLYHLSDQEVEPIRELLRERYDFLLGPLHIVLSGLCAECAKERTP